MKKDNGAFDENGDAITRGYVAPGLDKEAVSKEQLGNGYKDYELVKTAYEAGLEYAENHYLKLIEEKDKIIDDRDMLIIGLYSIVSNEKFE